MEQSKLSKNDRADSSINMPQGSGYETLAQDRPDGGYALDVLVSGVHCAGCIQKIESSLSSQKGMEYVRLNFSTRRLNMAWNGPLTLANDFVQLIENLGYPVAPYDPYSEKLGSDHEEKFLLICLGVAGFAMGNIMLFSVGLWSSSAETMGFVTRDFMHWMSAVIALPVVLFSGRPFFISAYRALSNGHTNMDVPISLAITLASVMSMYETITHGEHVYFDSAVMLMFFLLVGRYLDFRARRNARSAATDLLSTLSGFAMVEEGDKLVQIAIRDLKEGMCVRVAVGASFPIDGEVIEGQSDVDTSLITGETLPRDVNLGDEVFAGTINMSAPLRIRVARAAENSLLSDIVRLMERAGQGQAKYVRLADRMARAYTPVVHILALVGFLGWWLLMAAMWQDALMISVTILIITCPCALGLAVPVVQVLATGRLMKSGLLVKSGDALERLACIDTVFVDKTGTLTMGKPVLNGTYNPNHLKAAASLAGHSNHPLSKALSSVYQDNILLLSDIEEISGKGVRATYEGKILKLGSRAWCGDINSPATQSPELWFKEDGKPPVQFTFTDALRVDTAKVLEQFRAAHINIVLVSGDREEAVKAVAEQLQITDYHAQKTPTEKFALLEAYKEKGHKILMIGDGLNDAPVLAGADVSIAPGSAVDMAQNAADIVFMGDLFSPVYECYDIAVRAQQLVKQNFALAIIYNFIAVPLAFAGLVTPMVAALAMSGSSLVVIANSFRLKLK